MSKINWCSAVRAGRKVRNNASRRARVRHRKTILLKGCPECPKWGQTIENWELRIENEKTQNITLKDYPKYRSEMGSSNPAVAGPIKWLEKSGSSKVVKTECRRLSKISRMWMVNGIRAKFMCYVLRFCCRSVRVGRYWTIDCPVVVWKSYRIWNAVCLTGL